MTTVILGPRPPEVQALIEQRRERGLDGRDESWGGAYYVAPHAGTSHGALDAELVSELRTEARARGLVALAEFNLGTGPEDFTVPDGGVVERLTGLYAPSALLVLEVLSPGDATWRKLAHYAEHGVGELLVADPEQRTLRVWRLVDGNYVEGDTVEVLGLPVAELAQRIAWP